MFDINHVQFIASKLCQRKTAVEPFFGPVTQSLKLRRNPGGVINYDRFSPYDISQLFAATDGYNYDEPFQPFVYGGMGYVLRVGAVIDLTGCQLPPSFTTTSFTVTGTSADPFYQMAPGVTGLENVYILPYGATADDTLNCFGLPNTKSLYRYIYPELICMVSDDVFVGNFYTTLNQHTYDGRLSLAFTSVFPNQYGDFLEFYQNNIIITAEAATYLSGWTVANMFARDQYDPRQNIYTNPPFCYGFRFKMHYGSTRSGDYLTPAL